MPRAVLEGSDAKELELDAIGRGRGSIEEKTEKSTDERSRQKSPSQAEKGWVLQQASFQAVALILRLSRRLQPKAAPAPKRGSGPGTAADGGPPTGVKTSELLEALLKSRLKALEIGPSNITKNGE
jgi:hypothetical protein